MPLRSGMEISSRTTSGLSSSDSRSNSRPFSAEPTGSKSDSRIFLSPSSTSVWSSASSKRGFFMPLLSEGEPKRRSAFPAQVSISVRTRRPPGALSPSYLRVQYRLCVSRLCRTRFHYPEWRDGYDGQVPQALHWPPLRRRAWQRSEGAPASPDISIKRSPREWALDVRGRRTSPGSRPAWRTRSNRNAARLLVPDGPVRMDEAGKRLGEYRS